MCEIRKSLTKLYPASMPFITLLRLVGVGQSMYQIAEYTSVNNLGTAVLLERLVKTPVSKLIVASSMSVYGEGLYLTPERRAVHAGATRSDATLKAHEWEMTTQDGLPLRPVPTPETKQPSLASVYALSKYDQEQMCLMVGRAYGIPTVALRFFNAYGPYQSLSNPYTGVLAIFASRLLNGQTADHLRRRPATAGFRERVRHRAGLPAGAGGGAPRRT